MKIHAPTFAAGDVMNVHDANSLPIARMNAAKDAHRRHGTSGGKARAAMTATQTRDRDAGLDCHAIALATVAAIWSDFRSWSQEYRARPDGETFQSAEWEAFR